MSATVRSIVVILTAWLGTILAISLCGYVLATTGPVGEMESESERTGVPVAELVRSRVAKDPAFVREIYRSFEANDRFIDWLFLPALATAVGGFLGWTVMHHRRLHVATGLAPLGAFVLDNDVRSGLLYLTIAMVTAWAAATWKARKVPK